MSRYSQVAINDGRSEKSEIIRKVESRGILQQIRRCNRATPGHPTDRCLFPDILNRSFWTAGHVWPDRIRHPQKSAPPHSKRAVSEKPPFALPGIPGLFSGQLLTRPTNSRGRTHHWSAGANSRENSLFCTHEFTVFHHREVIANRLRLWVNYP